MFTVEKLIFKTIPFSQSQVTNKYNSCVLILALIHCVSVHHWIIYAQSAATVYTYTQLMNKSKTMIASPAY